MPCTSEEARQWARAQKAVVGIGVHTTLFASNSDHCDVRQIILGLRYWAVTIGLD